MIKRTIYKDLWEHLDKPEITILIGSRQAGKTTLIDMMRKDLQFQGKETTYFNLDRPEDEYFFQNQLLFIDRLKLIFGKNSGFVFIDEVQRLENAGLFLKGIYDRKLPYKLVVTGSGSLELKEKIQESLAGRKRMFEISTLSLVEFINYKTEYKFENKLTDFFRLEKDATKRFLDEYLVWGGYPRAVLAEKESEKIGVIDDIYKSYLEKDIRNLLGVIKGEEFTKLLIILASQSGQVCNVAEISATLGIDRETVKKYIWFLKKTFVIDEVKPFFNNTRKELTKRSVYYFCDVGLRNYILNRLSEKTLAVDGGFLFQNLVYLFLKNLNKQGLQKINYWRTKDGAEVDFVVNSGGNLWPIEVKYSFLKEIKISKSLKSFIKKYKPQKVSIVNLLLEKKLKKVETAIEAITLSSLIKPNHE